MAAQGAERTAPPYPSLEVSSRIEVPSVSCAVLWPRRAGAALTPWSLAMRSEA